METLSKTKNVASSRKVAKSFMFYYFIDLQAYASYNYPYSSFSKAILLKTALDNYFFHNRTASGRR